MSGQSKAIFDRIEMLFIDHVGPVATLLIQEATGAWAAQLKAENQKPSLRNISSFIQLLAVQISDPNDRQAFVDSVYEIEALLAYKRFYKG